MDEEREVVLVYPENTVSTGDVAVDMAVRLCWCYLSLRKCVKERKRKKEAGFFGMSFFFELCCGSRRVGWQWD